jgi:hypothetical protein
LYPTPSGNPSTNKTFFQLISTVITLSQSSYIVMIDVGSNQSRLHVDYSLDNATWQILMDKNDVDRPVNRFGLALPAKLLQRFVDSPRR